jgi:hypothetical protein
MNRDDTARGAGPNEGTGRRSSSIAVWAAVAAAVFAGVTALSNWQRNQYEIENKVFDVRVANDWSILIEQIGGPLYQIETVKLTPTFQEPTAKLVDGDPIEIPLRELETRTDKGLTRYVIDNPQELLCPPNKDQPRLTAACAETALSRVEVEFDVSGDPRTYVCRPGQCA